jgi:hypothetical protein
MKNTISNLQRFDIVGEYDLSMCPQADGDYVLYADVIKALQHAGQSEPVAWTTEDELSCVLDDGDGVGFIFCAADAAPDHTATPVPLFRSPQPAVPKGYVPVLIDDLEAIFTARQRGFDVQYIESYVGDLLHRANYTTPQPAVPEGYVLVPIEPTEAMIQASLMYNDYADSNCEGPEKFNIDIYKSMLSAAKGEQNDV